ncbi:integrin alpha-7-like [Penaeus monodon]|uniref:integrin alpha-7-like n=1 Tax=Penaeus monodon TaxID=6687 RepID=UPI0018A6DF62|nr:integrin alpha-7-like [Penaeus monodon]
MKEGPTPLGEVELTVDIPVNFTTHGKSVKFLNIHGLETNFQQRKFYCSLTGASFVPDEGAEGEVPTVLTDNGRQTLTKQHQGTPTMHSKETSPEPASLNCSNPVVSCARLSCLIKSWPSSSSVADVTVKLSLNLAVLARHISVKRGAVLKSFIRAKILSLNPELNFVGKKETDFVVMTLVQPDSPPGKGVPWWVILLTLLGGLLLLSLLTYGLYKAGFFRRKELEEMKAQRAQVDSSTVNAGLVED